MSVHSAMDVGIIDVGVSNIGSLRNSIEKLGCSVICSDRPDELESAAKLILPGVGSFGNAIQELKNAGLDSYIKRYVLAGGNILGICMGMQLLMECGEEGGVTKGLALVEGKVVKLPAGLGRIPHIGWNDIRASGEGGELMHGIDEGSNVYFVHSYHCEVTEDIRLIFTDYYGKAVVAGFQKSNVFGVQFHPEKSQGIGMSILKNFLEH